jgi:Uma2 family endonuclease
MAARKPMVYGMTYDEYSLLPDDGKRYQVIEGELIVSPSPNFRHQDTVWNLGQLLRDYAKTHNLGVVVGAPMDVILEPQTIVQPDLLFIRHENIGIIGDIIEGAPDLCIEVLSPSTGLHDRHTKKAVYARCGVREYWIVDPVRESVAAYDLDDGTYTLRAEASGDAVVSSLVLSGFAIPARAIFT